MIKTLCEENKIEYVKTSKLFFGQFSSSVTIRFPDYYGEYKKSHYGLTEDTLYRGTTYDIGELRKVYTRFQKKKRDFIQRFMKKVGDDIPVGTEYRSNNVSVTFYFEDEGTVANLIRNHGKLLDKVTSPSRPEEKAFLKANKKKLVRDMYYWNRYPYRVTFKFCYYDHELDGFVINNFGDGNALDYTRAHYYEAERRVLYLTSEDDLFLVEMAYPEFIENITEAVLSSDI